MSLTVSWPKLRWTLVAEEDMGRVELLWAAGRDGLAGGYRHSMSGQFVFYRSGTFADRLLIAQRLKELCVPYPNIRQASSAFHLVQSEVKNYDFDQSDDIWFIRNTTPKDCPQRLGMIDVRLIVECLGKPYTTFLSSDHVKPALKLLEALAERSTIESAFGRAESLDMLPLLRKLLLDDQLIVDDQPAFPADPLIPPILFLGHSSICVSSQDCTVVFDPVCLPETSAPNGRDMLAIARRADFIVISHHHWDHLHFQTLCLLPRDKVIIVPKVLDASLVDPPVALYLRSLGFENIIEHQPGDVLSLSPEFTLRFFPFRGESFGIGSVFSAFTYHVTFSGKTLFGSVDSCHDERGDMDETISQIASLGSLDFFFFGSSGLSHFPPYAAGGVHHFSNELMYRPDLVRYHPTFDDAKRWVDVLKPRFLLPYAQFIFRSVVSEDLHIDSLRENDFIVQQHDHIRHDSSKSKWLEDLEFFAKRVRRPVVLLTPMQGLVFR